MEQILLRSICRVLLPFIMPAVVLIAVLYVPGKWPEWFSQTHFSKELSALSIIIPYLPYPLFFISLLSAWRFRQTGMLLTAWLLGITYWMLHQGWCPPSDSDPLSGCWEVLTCLIVLEVTLFSLWRWRQLPLKSTAIWILVIAFQTGAVIFIKFIKAGSGLFFGGIISSPLLEKVVTFLVQWYLSIPEHFRPLPIIFSLAAFYLFFSVLRKRDILAAGLLGALSSVFFTLGPFETDVSPAIAFSAAGLILSLTALEASFSIAYLDELTGIPGRRALNQALSGLGRRYTIAMIDVDHFKKFNDTYGHKTGDQVLKLLASRLSRMSGGARAYRYGGEEFTAVFSGKSVKRAISHLETCRKQLSETPFIVRGKARKKASPSQRGGIMRSSGKQVRVTISIGVAEPSATLRTPSQVIAAADKALYEAKKAGRNCIKT